jgi:hypothetical protein
MAWDPEKNLAALKRVLAPGDQVGAALPALWVESRVDKGTVTFARTKRSFVLFRKQFGNGVFESRPVEAADVFQVAPVVMHGENLLAIILQFEDGTDWSLLTSPREPLVDALRAMGAHIGWEES